MPELKRRQPFYNIELFPVIVWHSREFSAGMMTTNTTLLQTLLSKRRIEKMLLLRFNETVLFFAGTLVHLQRAHAHRKQRQCSRLSAADGPQKILIAMASNLIAKEPKSDGLHPVVAMHLRGGPWTATEWRGLARVRSVFPRRLQTWPWTSATRTRRRRPCRGPSASRT